MKIVKLKNKTHSKYLKLGCQDPDSKIFTFIFYALFKLHNVFPVTFHWIL